MPAVRVLLVLVAFVATGCGAPERAPDGVASAGSGAGASSGAVARSVDPGRARAAPGAGILARDDRREGASGRPRVPAPPRRLPSGQTVRGAIERARLAGRIDRGTARSYHRIHSRARATLRRLGGVRRAELGAVAATLDGVAAAGALTSDRLPAAMLTLRRNLATWSGEDLPRPGERRTYGRDPLVFQHYAGRGMQLHPLAGFGRANALTRPCTAARHATRRHAEREAARAARLRRVGERFHRRPAPLEGPRCRRRALTRLLGRLVAVSSTRRGYRAWEYQFPYGGGQALWVSGMAQATAVQALARGSVALGRPDWMRVAHEALGAFEQPPPAGVRVASGRGVHYLLYSFAPDLRILNGFLQAVSGLHDVAELSGSRRARRLYAGGERAARDALAVYDTGAWSLYSAGGSEATLGYHVLVRDLAGALCRKTRRPAWCGAERRFARYLVEPPGLAVHPPRSARVARPTGVVLVLDRAAGVSMRIASRGGVRREHVELLRGRHVLPWTPVRRGAHRVTVTAVSRSGRRRVRETRLVVAPEPRAGQPRRSREDDAAQRGRKPRRGRPPAGGRARDERRAKAPALGDEPKRAEAKRRPKVPPGGGSGRAEAKRRPKAPPGGGSGRAEAKRRPKAPPGGRSETADPEHRPGTARRDSAAPEPPSVPAGGEARSGE